MSEIATNATPTPSPISVIVKTCPTWVSGRTSWDPTVESVTTLMNRLSEKDQCSTTM
jgi:hypothetical protein